MQFCPIAPSQQGMLHGGTRTPKPPLPAAGDLHGTGTVGSPWQWLQLGIAVALSPCVVSPQVAWRELNWVAIRDQLNLDPAAGDKSTGGEVFWEWGYS